MGLGVNGELWAGGKEFGTSAFRNRDQRDGREETTQRE